MALPALVLVQGGAHAADCWDLTVDESGKLAPQLEVFAVDLPGRRGKPATKLGASRVRDMTGELPAAVASFAFVNGVPRAGRRYLLNRLCADSPCIATEKVSRRDMPDDIPRTHDSDGYLPRPDGQ
jgi:hypothetical protein